ncbi:hypothetical protein ABZP36_000357 [Zizania latifolia]
MEAAAEVANPTGCASVVVPGLVQEKEQEPQEAEAQEVRRWTLVHPADLASAATPAIRKRSTYLPTSISPTWPVSCKSSLLFPVVGSENSSFGFSLLSSSQCCQKIRSSAASCKQLKKKGKPCPIRYCCKCLRNRYGENVEEVAKDKSWACPKCKDICNCSLCMKKKGLQPMGALAHTAKASGGGSVHELLGKGSEVVAELQKSSKKVRSSSLKNCAF